MTKLIDNSKSDDELLNELSDVCGEIVEKFEASEDHAILTLGVKLMGDGDDVEEVQTYINASGYYGILAEGLYAELGDQLANGNVALFSIIRDVIRDLEEEFGIEPDEEIVDDDSPSNYH
jgi:hypothetical protein